jgi:hypothetical protein
MVKRTRRERKPKSEPTTPEASATAHQGRKKPAPQPAPAAEPTGRATHDVRCLPGEPPATVGIEDRVRVKQFRPDVDGELVEVKTYYFTNQPAALVPSEATAKDKVQPESQECRLRFDEETWTVYLDGEPIEIEDPNAFILYQLIHLEGPITRRQIRKQHPRCKGDKTIPRLLDRLPVALLRTVQSGEPGYWVKLPPKKKSAPDRGLTLG